MTTFNNEGRDLTKDLLADLTEEERDTLNRISPATSKGNIRLGERMAIIEQKIALLGAAAGAEFVATGTGSEVGLVLTQSDGSKRILYFENGEYTDDAYTP